MIFTAFLGIHVLVIYLIYCNSLQIKFPRETIAKISHNWLSISKSLTLRNFLQSQWVTGSKELLQPERKKICIHCLFWRLQSTCFWLKTVRNKKVLLCERKRHTAHHVASAHSAVLSGGGGCPGHGGYPILGKPPARSGVPPPRPGLGYPWKGPGTSDLAKNLGLRNPLSQV